MKNYLLNISSLVVYDMSLIMKKIRQSSYLDFFRNLSENVLRDYFHNYRFFITIITMTIPTAAMVITTAAHHHSVTIRPSNPCNTNSITVSPS